MLVLTRKPNQQLHIGNDIVITVVKVRGNTIRLGIEAPKDVRVIRSELEPKVLEPKVLEAKVVEPRVLEAKVVEIPSTSSPSTVAQATGSEPGSPAAEFDDQSGEEAAAAADDAPSVCDVQLDVPEITTARLLLKPRDRSGASSGLKGFRNALRSHAAFTKRNPEDCPLCHRAPRAGHTHSNLAHDTGSSPLGAATARASIG